MNLKNIKTFINTATQGDITYVCRRAGITYEYFVYHIATGRKTPSEKTAAILEAASTSLSKRRPHVKRLRCTDFIEHYKTCPHEV